MNAFVRGGSRHPRYLKGFSWLWQCFGIQGFGVQGTSYRINEAKQGFWFLEVRHGLLFMILEAHNHIDSSILSTFHQLRFGKFTNLHTTYKKWSQGKPSKRKGVHPNNFKKNCPPMYFELLKPSPTLGFKI